MSTVKNENLSIKVFDSTKTNLEKFNVVQLKIRSCSSSNFKIIEAIVVSPIRSPLSGQFIELAKNQYTHLNSIQLSDCNVSNSDSQIDVLIGAGHYWDFMTGKVKRENNKRLKKGPAILKTYDIIKSEDTEGITEEPTTILKPPGEVHYPPHHPVI